MKLKFFSGLLLICLNISAQSDEELRSHILKLDQAHASAIFSGDAASLDTLMHDDITVNHPTNRIVKEKAELLALIRKGIIRYSRFERTPESVLFFENMVVVMGNEVVVPAKGAPNAGKVLKRRYSNFWMLNNGRWQLTVRHANNLCEN